MKLLNILNRLIEYGFYAIFLFVPLAFTSDTSELFEFNKLWLTFVLTIIIATAWFAKMVVERQIKIQRTPLDIPILLFLASQVISTILSIDRHVSLWGYYSRFNGGLYSIIAYIFLYYAFVSNLANLKAVKRILKVSLISGAIVALWGLPSHFGYDPTCLAFRGTFDVSCWTNDFQPKVRIFSTLGQPDWLAAYLAILIPVSIGLFFDSFRRLFSKGKFLLTRKGLLSSISYLFLTLLFYADLMYTTSRSGAIAVWPIVITLCGAYFIYKLKSKNPEDKPTKLFPVYLVILFIVVTFLTSVPFGKLQQYTLPNIITGLNAPRTQVNHAVQTTTTTTVPASHVGELGGTDSTKIRLIVWEGAIGIWESNPLFGSGVETFAYAYYNHRPAAHNLTSEWNFLYNKAHNEFLNYLATTGIFGLGSYLYFIVLFLVLYYKTLKKLHWDIGGENFLSLALVASFATILITNFFGFSVVITNIYLFIIPGLVLVMLGLVNEQKFFALPKNRPAENLSLPVNTAQKISIGVITIAGIYLLVILVVFWNADRNYAYGVNLDRNQLYQQARPYLVKSIEERPGEPTFRDEYAINTAVLATLVASQKDSTESAELAQNLAQEASAVSENLTKNYPKNVVYLKTKTRVYYTLSRIDPRYLTLAQESIKNAASLAPTDANIIYNYAIITSQVGDINKAVELSQKVIKLKPDYTEAYYALGIFYEELAIDKQGQIVNRDYHQKAITQMQFILKNLSPNDTRVKDTLSSWEKK